MVLIQKKMPLSKLDFSTKYSVLTLCYEKFLAHKLNRFSSQEAVSTAIQEIQALPQMAEPFFIDKEVIVLACHTYQRGFGFLLESQTSRDGTGNVVSAVYHTNTIQHMSNGNHTSCVWFIDAELLDMFSIQSLLASIQNNGKHIIVPVAVTESVKTWEYIRKQTYWHECMLESSMIGVIGGGVLSDIFGFLAYLYGKSWCVYPTTSLACVDASIGGKTGVNWRGFKNYIGAFYPPQYIGICLSALQNLPKNQWVYGLVEGVKHTLLQTKSLLYDIDYVLPTDAHDPMVLDFIQRNIQFKHSIVSQDPFELHGIRAILNKGHTLGHALETVYIQIQQTRHTQSSTQANTLGYWMNFLPHGVAVWFGLWFEEWLWADSTKQTHTIQNILFDPLFIDYIYNPYGNIIKHLLQQYPTDIVFAMLQDKKNSTYGTIRFVAKNYEFLSMDSQEVQQKLQEWLAIW
jgi:3-dehydroquinate synthetase